MTPRNENAHRPGRALPTASKASGKLSPGTEDGKPGGGEPWPEPLPLPAGEDRVPELTADLLPPALRGWLADVAERMQVPLEFPTVAALVSLSSLIGRKVAIRPKRRDDWSEFGNLWGLVVGWPGILKTPAMEAAIDPLRRMEAEAIEAYRGAHADDEANEGVRRAKVRGLENRIADETQKNPAADVEALHADLRKLKAPAAPMRRYITNDPTVERLGMLLAENPNGLLLYRDELMGWLRRMEREGNESDRAFYLELWTGRGTSSADRVGRGFVSHPRCLSVIGSIQPGPFADYIRAATLSGRGDDGLVQRFQLAVWPELSTEYAAIDRAPDLAARDGAHALFRCIDSMRPDELGAEQEDGLHFVRFGESAQGLFSGWLEQLERRIRSLSSGLPAVMAAHLGKYRGLCARLALLFHVIACADAGAAGPVSEESARLAIRWCAFLEGHARRIYGQAMNAAQGEGRALAQHILSRHLPDGFVAREVVRKGWRGLKTHDAVAAGLEDLLRLHWLRAVPRNTGGRGTVEYRINPRVYGQPQSTDKTDRSAPAAPVPTELAP